jgi:hypothetical protein
MKSTIRLHHGHTITIQPGVIGMARIDLSMMGVGLGGVAITPEQAGAIIAALEACFPEQAEPRASEGAPL